MSAPRHGFDTDRAARLYLCEKRSLQQIARALGASFCLVRNRLVEDGVPLRRQAVVNVGACRFDGCVRPAQTTGLCGRHYSRARHHGEAGLEAPKQRHGKCGSLTWQSWTSMISRCTYPGTNGYADYGGRGITVCEAWRRSFAAFLRDVGRRPTRRHSIDRIDTNGHYEPGNVRWATARQQRINRRARAA